jgi:tRNA (5-methylaminomethyl-2-thiouridylate)-methyltransferase
MKIAVLISGGVDSSVALALLKEQGYDVTAFYLKIWLEDELSSLGTCPWQEDLRYVTATCDQLSVPLEIVSLQQEYWDHIVTYTIAEVKAGRTPNPDIFCNAKVKFGFFLQHIDTGYEKVATGHYAQSVQHGTQWLLKKSPDAIKDQTYFLSYLRQEQLARSMFPIGHLAKKQVREYAHSLNLPAKDRKDSQGICFLGKFKFSEFIRHHLGEQRGDLIEFESGKKIGTHNGFWYYTSGQRQGIGLAGGPWYVVDKNIDENLVFISRTYYTSDKIRRSFYLQDVNWFLGGIPEKKELSVKIRHGVSAYKCGIELYKNGMLAVNLSDNDQGIAPGQFAVFYDDDDCLGGGIIRTCL